MQLVISITPSGRIVCQPETHAQDDALSDIAIDDTVAAELLDAFSASTATGLLHLAGLGDKMALPLTFVFWRNWAQRFLKAVSQLDDERFAALEKAAKSGKSVSSSTNSGTNPAPPDELALAVLVADAPPMRGLEFLTNELLKTLWIELLAGFLQRAHDTEGGCRGLLLKLNPDAHLLGRVTFHLAENKRDPDRPFAFLATYAHRLSAKSQVQHLPLGEALRQYAAERDQAKLTELLVPVRAAASHCLLYTSDAADE